MKRQVSDGKDIKIDDGIFFGLGVFETLLVLDKPVKYEMHLTRLNNAINDLGLGKEIKAAEFIELISGYNNCVLKVLVTEQNIIVQKRDISYTEMDYNNGFKLKLSKVIKSSTSKLVYYKSINYLENIIEKRAALKEGFNEPLFLNEKGFITEGATSNIFIVKNNVISTPLISCGILNGTVRKWVIDNFEVVEKEITIEELKDADEVFITNSLMGIMKVVNFEEIEYNDTMVINKIRNNYFTYLKNWRGK